MKIPRLARKGRAYYYVTSTAPRRWIALGSDYAAALAKWAELEGRPQGSTVAALWATRKLLSEFSAHPAPGPRARKRKPQRRGA